MTLLQTLLALGQHGGCSKSVLPEGSGVKKLGLEKELLGFSKLLNPNGSGRLLPAPFVVTTFGLLRAPSPFMV